MQIVNKIYRERKKAEGDHGINYQRTNYLSKKMGK